MIVSKAEPVRITRKLDSEEKRSMLFTDMIRRRPTVKKLQEKKYSVPLFVLARNVG